MSGLLSSEERLVWRLEPLEQGRKVLGGLTAIMGETDGRLVTVFAEQHAGEWSRQLMEAGVSTKEMNRKLPALEDLFLELTGGETID